MYSIDRKCKQSKADSFSVLREPKPKKSVVFFVFFSLLYDLNPSLFLKHLSSLWYLGGPVLCSGEKAELWLEQLRLGRRRQLVKRERRPGSELCGRRRLGQWLGRGGHRHNVDQHDTPSARRGAISQRLQLGNKLSQSGQSEWSVRQRVPEKHNQHYCHHGEDGKRQKHRRAEIDWLN